MATLVGILAELVTSALELLRLMLFDVALRDPLSFVVWTTGAVLMAGTLLAFAYLALGALASAVSVTPARPPQRAE